MDCKSFEQNIPDFLEDRLDNKTTREFLDHYETCKDCREELSIQYLVYEGLKKMETGETFNLERDLLDCVEQSKEKNLARRKLCIFAYTFEAITAAAFISVLAVMISRFL